MVWLLTSPPRPSASFLSFSVLSVAGVELSDGRQRGKTELAKSYDVEKAWSSITHSILSGAESCGCGFPTWASKDDGEALFSLPRQET
jgi:hypothetical protein